MSPPTPTIYATKGLGRAAVCWFNAKATDHAATFFAGVGDQVEIHGKTYSVCRIGEPLISNGKVDLTWAIENAAKAKAKAEDAAVRASGHDVAVAA